MPSTLTQNHFELFSLPQSYVLERAQLDARYRDMQRSVHPDRYASASDRERRISMQQATQINEAYEVLKDPLKRGRYLLALLGLSGAIMLEQFHHPFDTPLSSGLRFLAEIIAWVSCTWAAVQQSSG